jgi:molecular chaperone GrpE
MDEQEKQEHKTDNDEVDLDIESDSVESDTEPELIIESDIDPLQEIENRLLRLQAEFDNYRKRMESRYSEVAKYAAESIILKILDVHDNLERALASDFKADPESAKKGVEGIADQLTKILVQEDVRPIESLGMPFDPYYHNAISRKHDSTKDDGVVIEEYQRGYMMKERVLRPAVVCVNRHEVIIEDDPNDKEETGE